MNIEINGLYKHFKGDIVKVLTLATHTENNEVLVIYEHNNQVWARPISMFLSEVDKEKYPEATQKYRFQLIDNEQTV